MEDKTPKAMSYTAVEWITAAIFLVAVLIGIACCSNMSGNKDGETTAHTTALKACREAAKTEYPYGFDYKLGKTAFADLAGGGTRVIFKDAKIGNVFGGQATGTVYCLYKGGKVTDINAII